MLGILDDSRTRSSSTHDRADYSGARLGHDLIVSITAHSHTTHIWYCSQFKITHPSMNELVRKSKLTIENVWRSEILRYKYGALSIGFSLRLEADKKTFAIYK